MFGPTTKTRLIGIAGAAAMMAALTACGESSNGASGSSAVSVAYSSPVAAQPGQQQIAQGFKAGASELGWSAQVIDANLSADAQVSNVQTMIQKQVNAIALWTLDPGAMQGTFAQAASAKIPVIAINSEGDHIVSSVWWELYLCGDNAPLKQSAQRIAKARPGGKVIVLGGPPVPSLQANVKCFSDAARAAGLTIVNQTDNTKNTSDSAAMLTADLFSKYRDVAAVWAFNDTTALGASASAVQAGLTISNGTSPGVIIEGTNGDPEAIDAIKQGRLTGTWDPNAVVTGMALIKAMQDAMRGETGKRYVLQSAYYDASNIGNYVAPEQQSFKLDNLPIKTSNR
jgi:ribose transport system substrate-binding protein